MNKLNLADIDSFDWDTGNLNKNWLKHKVERAECEQLFFDQPIYMSDQDHSQQEPRFQTLGLTNFNRLLFIVFTVRNNKIRIISARNSNKREQAIYQKEVNLLEKA